MVYENILLTNLLVLLVGCNQPIYRFKLPLDTSTNIHCRLNNNKLFKSFDIKTTHSQQDKIATHIFEIYQLIYIN